MTPRAAITGVRVAQDDDRSWFTIGATLVRRRLSSDRGQRATRTHASARPKRWLGAQIAGVSTSLRSRGEAFRWETLRCVAGSRFARRVWMPPFRKSEPTPRSHVIAAEVRLANERMWFPA